MGKLSYRHKSYELVMDGSQGHFYDSDKLMFRGFSYYAMLMFIRACNDPTVTLKFQSQLNMREKPKFKSSSEDKRPEKIDPPKKKESLFRKPRMR